MRKFFILFLPAIIIFLGVIAWLSMQTPDTERLHFVHRKMTDRIYAKWNKKLASIPRDRWQIVNYDTLLTELNFFEKNFIDNLFAFDPKELGFNGPFYSLTRPDSLIVIPGDTLGAKILGARYAPAHIYNAFGEMSDSMESEIGKRVYINSGYRSPGRQAYGVIDDLVMERNDYSLKKASRWVAMPGYSEHNSSRNTAVDVINAEGISGEEPGQKAEDFEKLPEYEWMVKNAGTFGFYNTYPRNNDLGVEFEPWHWHWEKRRTENKN